jgi:glycosyltransferase involved in cell wall biosynthesis
MNTIVENPDGITAADIIVGIPSLNEADSISVPTDAAGTGLKEFFPNSKAVVINVDNHSDDGTKEAFFGTPTPCPKVYISTPEGVRGKGNNFRNLFRAAVELEAKAVVVVDADLKTITPSWIKYLGEPILAGFDYVSPLYVRHKYDGTITNHIAYPMVRSLFGLRVRQPIGGDFGFSGKLARAYMSERLWTDKSAHFGIDIWMTTIAIARQFKVCQAFLGTPKGHKPKDPAADLTPMFTQVVSTLFDLVTEFEYFWKEVKESQPSSVFGFGLGVSSHVDPIEIDTAKLLASFQEGCAAHSEMWAEVLPPPLMHEVERLAGYDSADHFEFSTTNWARILFDFAVENRNHEIPQDDLLKALVPFYHARLLSYVNRTLQMDTREAEEYLENISRTFQREKYYLIQRWDAKANMAHERLFT